MFKSLLLLLLLLPTSLSHADSVGLGYPLPVLNIEDRGELLLENDEISYAPWALRSFTGKVHILQYMAGTSGASKLNEPFTDRLKEIGNGNYHVTTLINLDDAMWGTTGFVVGEVEKNKRKFPLSSLVLDADGLGKSLWNLESNSSAIFILNTDGTVHFIKDGAMSETEIEQALEFISSKAPNT